MARQIETIIIGGGQAGLATSYYLSRKGREHIVFEQATQAGNAWRNDRWDSFTLNTPNWCFRLPGAAYSGSAPDGFLERDEIVAAALRWVGIPLCQPIGAGQPGPGHVHIMVRRCDDSGGWNLHPGAEAPLDVKQ